MQRAALLAPVISGAVEHIREVGCGPGAFHGRGNQGVTLSRGAAGGCSGGGAAMLLILTWSIAAVHQVGIVAVVVSQVKKEVILAL